MFIHTCNHRYILPTFPLSPTIFHQSIPTHTQKQIPRINALRKTSKVPPDMSLAFTKISTLRSRYIPSYSVLFNLRSKPSALSLSISFSFSFSLRRYLGIMKPGFEAKEKNEFFFLQLRISVLQTSIFFSLGQLRLTKSGKANNGGRDS